MQGAENFLRENSLPVLTYTVNIWRTLKVDENIVIRKFLTQKILQTKLTRIMVLDLTQINKLLLLPIQLPRAFINLVKVLDVTEIVEVYKEGGLICSIVHK